MSDYIALDAQALEQQLQHLFAAYPELAEDETLRADMLEGETDLESIAARIVKRRAYAKGNAQGAKAVMDDAKARKERFEREADAMTAMLLRIMRAAQADKLVLPQATVSMRKPSTSADVSDPDALPQGYFTIIRQPDKNAIKAALEAGETIPGASLKTGEPGLTIRTK